MNTAIDTGAWIAPLFVAAIIAVVSVLSGWRRKAKRADLASTISDAIDRSKDEIKGHVDGKVDGLSARIDDLAKSVESIDARETETRMQLAHLQGRFDQTQAMQAGGA